ncbi:MAG: acyltransferase family protein [Phenylobacterium sp.]|uniref:acyltransferase family protein n=1 Tax=Phenylobacterium sp. TaxID=1871053 RepID=UPI0025CCBC99|nr:acyltransferase family protein [Phenylobacterium sp.]MBI1196552.1 acyltransferase family protein [Phenylobacterium sp.]
MDAATRRPGRASGDIAYRPDIDGLRAVAVMLVVLDHASAPFMSGGYVGVDVFFVISGFLITSLIAAQRQAGRFRFADFYWRRAKRLLPALYAMILATLAVGWRLLIPSDYSLLSESALWAAGFASNVFFWLKTGGYFSADATAFPLLHVWSLSVEEQFYFLWPAALAVLLGLRSGRLRIGLVALLALASLAYAQYEVSLRSTAAYFLIPSRACEFLAGALLAMAWRPRRASAATANAASVLGLALILGSAVLLDARSPFPGLAALPACLGAALIIAAPLFGPSLVTALLSTRAFVFVGLCSYSIYLWHWPIVSFLRISRIPITPAITCAIVAASLAIGATSWLLLERGFRGLLDRLNRPATAVAALASAALLGLPLYIRANDGLPDRFPYALLTADQLMAERSRYWRALPAKDVNLSTDAARQLLVVGDSHAYDLAYAVNSQAGFSDIALVETDWQCFNFGRQAVSPSDAPHCAERLKAVLASRNLTAADAVYLHDRWGGYDEAGLADMLQRLRARTAAPIYVFGPQMQFTDDVLTISKLAQRQHLATVNGINGFSRRYQRPEVARRDRALKAFFARTRFPGVRYISTLDVQCGPQLACDVLSPSGQYLYFDNQHFTLEGSRRYGAELRRRYPGLWEPARDREVRPGPGAPVRVIAGGPGDDRLDGAETDDTILGQDGADTIQAYGGRDTVRGGKGDDRIECGDGDDWVSGDRGDDTLAGGRGADTFHAFAGSGLDLIEDFSAAEGDRVELEPGTAFRIRQAGRDTVIELEGGRVVLKHVEAARLPAGAIYVR